MQLQGAAGVGMQIDRTAYVSSWRQVNQSLLLMLLTGGTGTSIVIVCL